MPAKKIMERKITRSEQPVVYISVIELVNRIAAKTKVRKVDVRELVDALGEVVRETLYQGQSVFLPGIGRIEYQVRSNKRFNPYNQVEIPMRPYPRLQFLPDMKTRTTIRRAFDAERERRLNNLVPTESEVGQVSEGIASDGSPGNEEISITGEV